MGLFHRLCVVIACLFLSACTIQRAQMATEARTSMIGMTKEQVLACMGPPQAKAAEGTTEVWSYASGDGSTTTAASVYGGRWSAGGIATSSVKYCNVNVAMSGGRVSQISFTGPTGGLLTQGEQCRHIPAVA
jgi:hypothetical protein